MVRHFARAAATALCAIWVAGCGMAGTQAGPQAGPQNVADSPAAPVTAADQSAASLPTTLEGEIAKAHLLRVKGDYPAAVQALGQLMLVAPDDPRVVGEYGKVLAQQGRSQDALPFVRRALELQANDWSLYSALGVVYDQLDDHAQARTAYEHALSLRPGAPEVLNNYAVSRMLAGDLDGAQKLLAQASAAGPGNDKIANNLALLASMKRPAGAAAPLVQNPPLAERAKNHPVTGAPQTLASGAPRVLMQMVPTDAQAGPVAHKWTPSPRLATSSKHKPRLTSAKPALRPAEAAHSAPTLRTAADNQ